MEEFICTAAVLGVFALIFVIRTQTRLRKQDDLIGKLRKDFFDLRSEIREEKSEQTMVTAVAPEIEKTETAECFDEAEGAATKTATPKITEPEVTPPPLPSAAERAVERAATASKPEAKFVEVKPEPKPAGPSRLRQFLERINLWPPSGDTAAEATIGAWWATRVGLIVAIIGATFGGIYVAEGAPPWARVVAMTAISIGVVFLGVWLEKRITVFGRLISSGGLGLGYFTAFAAFALEPMKVIASPTMGLFAQTAMLAVMVGWSLWKRDEMVAGMAILLGYVSCWFSLQNDQMNFVVAGLMLLAVAASFLLWRKQWLWSQGVAILGTWGGFFLLGLFEWHSSNAPPFGVLLACLAGAVLIFEAGHFFAGGKIEVKTMPAKWLRRLSVLSSSLSIFVGYIVISETYPGLKAAFYLMFAALMLVFTLAHFFRKKEISRGLEQMFFLKTSALLCLFFVAQFDGPVRWLSIALQAGAVLWTWRRTRYKWLEVAFGVLFFVAIGTLIRGVAVLNNEVWSLFSPQNLVGVASLTALSFWLTLHRVWRFPLEKKQPGINSSHNPLYVLGAALIAIGAWFLVSVPTDFSDHLRPVFLMITSFAMALPLLRWAKAGPVLAASAIMVLAFAKIITHAGEMAWGNAVTISLIAAVLAIGVAELCRSGWQKHWMLGNTFRTIFAGFGMVLLWTAANVLVDHLDGISVISLLALAVVGVFLLWQNSRKIGEGYVSDSSGSHLVWQRVLSGLIGVFITVFGIGIVSTHASVYGCVWLAVAGVILAGAAFFTRSSTPALAAIFPMAISLLAYLSEFDREGGGAEHRIASVAMLAIFVGAAVGLYYFTRGVKSGFLTGIEAVLLAAVALIFHWSMRPFFDASEIVAADCALALGMLALARKWPMRTLKPASGWVVGYVILHAAMFTFDVYHVGPRALWWVAAVLILVWAWLYNQGDKIRPLDFSSASLDANVVFDWPAGLATAVFWIVSCYGVDKPWNTVAFAGFAILVLAFWRFGKGAGGHFWTWILLAAAIVACVFQINNSTGNSGETLAAVLITTGLIVLHGVLCPRHVGEFRRISIGHAVPALGLAFWACGPDVLTVNELTTVCWGVASITIFVIGLIAGLKTYRIVGLVGLALCIGRMFIVDINDTFYRIVAFLGVAGVLLFIGFLYHRFRNRIENQFSGKTE